MAGTIDMSKYGGANMVERRAFCTACGEKTTGDNDFCIQCGSSLLDRHIDSSPMTVEDDGARTTFCENCGAAGSASFCTTCGAALSGSRLTTSDFGSSVGRDTSFSEQNTQPTRAPTGSVPLRTGRRRIGLFLGVAAVLLTTAAGSVLLFTRLGPQSDAVSNGNNGNTSAGDDAAANNNTATTDSGDIEPSAGCPGSADVLVEDVLAWSASLGLATSADGDQVDWVSCTDNVLLDDAAIELEDQLSSRVDLRTDDIGALAFALDPDEPVKRIANERDSAQEKIRWESFATDLPKWIAVLESMETNEHSQEDAVSRASNYRSFSSIAVFDSSDYTSVRDGYWVVAADGFDGFDSTLLACERAGLNSASCYPRYLQDATADGTGIAGGCGQYGVVNAAIDSTVYLHPRRVSSELIGRIPTGVEVVLAGYSDYANGDSWLPIHGSFANNNNVGWVSADGLELTQNCLALQDLPFFTSCDDVAAHASDLLSRGEMTPPYKEVLALRAMRLDCDRATVNAQIADMTTVRPSAGLEEGLRSLIQIDAGIL